MKRGVAALAILLAGCITVVNEAPTSTTSTRLITTTTEAPATTVAPATTTTRRTTTTTTLDFREFFAEPGYVAWLERLGIDTSDEEEAIGIGRGLCTMLGSWENQQKLTPAEAWDVYLAMPATRELQHDTALAYRVLFAAHVSFCLEETDTSYITAIGVEAGILDPPP